MDGMFPCKTRANTAEFNQGHERTFSKSTRGFCPHCKVQVRTGDVSCWQCKEKINEKNIVRM